MDELVADVAPDVVELLALVVEELDVEDVDVALSILTAREGFMLKVCVPFTELHKLVPSAPHHQL